MSIIDEVRRFLGGGAKAGDPVRAVWNGMVIAESDDTVVVEGNHYFPADAVNRDFLEPSSHQTVCPWKGRAHYYDVVAGDERQPAAAWAYPRPTPAARRIKDRVAFWRGVRVEPVDQS